MWTHLPTGFEFWDKPPLFGTHDLARTPRNLTVEQAAIELQVRTSNGSGNRCFVQW